MKSLQEPIISELQQKEAVVKGELTYIYEMGKEQRALENLIFYTAPRDFLSSLNTIQEQIKADYDGLEEIHQEKHLSFLVDLTLGLRSFLPRWNLQNAKRHGEFILSDTELEEVSNECEALAVELAARSPRVGEELLASWKRRAIARLKAEKAQDPEGVAGKLVGNAIGEYITNLCRELGRSNLRRIAELRAEGQTPTEISNDYAAYLQYAMYLGASFVTCNPPLVDAAWVADPEYWNPIVDRIVQSNYEEDGDALARLVTLEVVLENMRQLRPIFLLTEGRMGCVCLQVNPKDHGNAEAMISDALFFYEALGKRLEGGVPNVVFKLPGTDGGLGACRALTKRGIGVTITVNFGMFQHLPFAQAIHEGRAIFSNLVEMNGRLAFPVRDELLSKVDELAGMGITEVDVRTAAAWSGVAVAKRLYKLMVERGIDLEKIKLLIASLRVYDGEEFGGLPSAFPDITELVGTSIISVFPDVRRSFDEQREIEITPLRIETPIPEAALEILAHSEIFKQAYYVSDRDWVMEEDQRFQPDRELTLADEAGTANWAPVHDTLKQFCDSYDVFVERILGRKEMLNL